MTAARRRFFDPSNGAMILSMAVAMSALRMLSSTGETASVPGSKGRKPVCVPCAKATPASDSSNTWLGGGSVTSCEIWLNRDMTLQSELTPQYEKTPQYNVTPQSG